MDDTDYYNNDSSGLQQASAADSNDVGSGDIAGIKGVPLVSRKELSKADSHLQDVIDNIITQQRQMASSMDPNNGPSRAVQAALSGGVGQFGSYGENAMAGNRAAAPLIQQQQENYVQAQEKMNALRIQAAQAESNRQKGLIQAQLRGSIYNQKRDDAAFRGGYRIDANGNPVADQNAMNALRQKALMIEKGRRSAQGLDIFSNDAPSTLGTPTTELPTGGAPSVAATSPTALPHSQAILMAESNNSDNAPPGDGGKAIGPGQLHEAAAKEVGVTDRADPEQNRAGSAAYLAKYTDVFKDKENPALWATVAYKDGPGKAANWNGDIQNLPAGTQAYIKKVDGYMSNGLLNDAPIPGLKDKLQALTPNMDAGTRNRIQAMIEGRANKLAGFGSNSPYGIALTNLVNKVDPTYDEHRFATITDFDTGATSKIIRPINTSIAHLDTLLKYGDALDNGDVQLINKAKNDFAAQFGKTAPTSFDAIKPIVANEVVKAIVARGGGEADRAEAQKALSAAKTPQQLKEIVDAEKQLLAGQMNSMEQTYVAGTGGLQNFKQKYLTSATRQALGAATTGGAAPQFPMTVRNGSKVAKVANAEELKEAQSEGFK